MTQIAGVSPRATNVCNKYDEKAKVSLRDRRPSGSMLVAASAALPTVVHGDPAVAGGVAACDDATARLAREASAGATIADPRSVLVWDPANGARPHVVGLNEPLLTAEDAHITTTSAWWDSLLGALVAPFARPFRGATGSGPSRGSSSPCPFRGTARLGAAG